MQQGSPLRRYRYQRLQLSRGAFGVVRRRHQLLLEQLYSYRSVGKSAIQLSSTLSWPSSA